MSNGDDRMKVTTPSDRELAMSWVFDAPRARLFGHWIKPELLRRWLLGPPGNTMVVCDVDPRPGGAYRYVWRNDATGAEMGLGGVYRVIVPPERIVATEAFDQPWYPGGEALDTITLAEQDGKTTMTTTVRYPSREARDIALNSGMSKGVAAGYERLEGLLAEAP